MNFHKCAIMSGFYELGYIYIYIIIQLVLSNITYMHNYGTA